MANVSFPSFGLYIEEVLVLTKTFTSQDIIFGIYPEVRGTV